MTVRVLRRLTLPPRPILEYRYGCRGCRRRWSLFAHKRPEREACPFCGGVGALGGR